MLELNYANLVYIFEDIFRRNRREVIEAANNNPNYSATVVLFFCILPLLCLICVFPYSVPPNKCFCLSR